MSYLEKQILKSLKFIIPEEAKVLSVNRDTEHQLETLDSREKFDFILIRSVENLADVKVLLNRLKKHCEAYTRIVLVHNNYLWRPFLKLQSWISQQDIYNFVRLSHYELLSLKMEILIPFYVPVFSYLLNRFVARLPFFRLLTLKRITVVRPLFPSNGQPYSVSVVIPCKNEAGNIEPAVQRIPPLGKHTEILFCDDQSTDGTETAIKEVMQKYQDKDIQFVRGPGLCKSENVWAGFEKAKGDILIILDGDLTVLPEELTHFYEALALGIGEFINGSRLVYPMHKKAMRFLNAVGNKIFSILFSYIIDTPIKDTLCGSKALWKRDCQKIIAMRHRWKIQDRWGDHVLILGAAKNHLRIIDLPVHYTERLYGTTKMTNRLKNGWTMLKITGTGLLKLKFY